MTGFVRMERVISGGRFSRAFYCGRCDHEWHLADLLETLPPRLPGVPEPLALFGETASESIQRHVECPTREIAGRTLREVLEGYFGTNERAVPQLKLRPTTGSWELVCLPCRRKPSLLERICTPQQSDRVRRCVCGLSRGARRAARDLRWQDSGSRRYHGAVEVVTR